MIDSVGDNDIIYEKSLFFCLDNPKNYKKMRKDGIFWLTKIIIPTIEKFISLNNTSLLMLLF